MSKIGRKSVCKRARVGARRIIYCSQQYSCRGLKGFRKFLPAADERFFNALMLIKKESLKVYQKVRIVHSKCKQFS